MPDLLTSTRTLTVSRLEMLEGLSAVSGAVPSRRLFRMRHGG
jgi:hypothetical protein